MTGSGEIVGALEPAKGEAAQGGAAQGEAGEGHTHEALCLNCGAALVGPHCHQCGQAAHVHRTLGAFFHDLLHGVFHFEGKIWRTLPLLAWQPGRLTRDYIDGRRASHVSPIALFLFCVFLMFAVIRQFGGQIGDSSAIDVNGVTVTGLAENEAAVAALKQKRIELVRVGKPTDALDGEIAGREGAIAAIREMRGGFSAAELKDTRLTSDVPAIQHTLDQFKANPGLVFYKLQNNAYKFSWALIPLSVPFVWLLFAWRRRYPLYDHTVFVTYSLCFMMLLVSLLALGRAAGIPFLEVVLVLVPPLHMYRQLRGAYALGRGAALWRTGALLTIAVAALLAFAVPILAQTGG